VQAALTALTGRRGHRTMVLAIGFGADQATASRQAATSLSRRFDRTRARYASGWASYLGRLRQPPKPVRDDPALRKLYRQSLLVLAASEDKQNRGASVASPTMPWTWGARSRA
jgi:glucoamylase